MATKVRVALLHKTLQKASIVLTDRCSMYGTAYMFSKTFFTGWVIVSLLWAVFSFSGVTVYPIIEGRHLLVSWVKALFGKGVKGQHGDEFDHHQHRQRYDDQEVAETSQEEISATTLPVELKK